MGYYLRLFTPENMTSDINARPELDVFKSKDPKYLYKLTDRLFYEGVFNCYLNPQQFNLLDLILHSANDDSELQLSIFNSFMNNNLSLKFTEPKPTLHQHQLLPNQLNTSPAPSPAPFSPQTPSTGLSISDSIQELNNNEVFLKPGTKSANKLCSTVRYLIWEKAIDFYFEEDNENHSIYDTLAIDYSSDEDNDRLEGMDGVENNEKPQTRKLDDDYDDDDNYDDNDGEFEDAQEKIHSNKIQLSAIRKEEDDFDDDEDYDFKTETIVPHSVEATDITEINEGDKIDPSSELPETYTTDRKGDVDMEEADSELNQSSTGSYNGESLKDSESNNSVSNDSEVIDGEVVKSEVEDEPAEKNTNEDSNGDAQIDGLEKVEKPENEDKQEDDKKPQDETNNEKDEQEMKDSKDEGSGKIEKDDEANMKVAEKEEGEKNEKSEDPIEEDKPDDNSKNNSTEKEQEKSNINDKDSEVSIRDKEEPTVSSDNVIKDEQESNSNSDENPEDKDDSATDEIKAEDESSTAAEDKEKASEEVEGESETLNDLDAKSDNNDKVSNEEVRQKSDDLKAEPSNDKQEEEKQLTDAVNEDSKKPSEHLKEETKESIEELPDGVSSDKEIIDSENIEQDSATSVSLDKVENSEKTTTKEETDSSDKLKKETTDIVMSELPTEETFAEESKNEDTIQANSVAEAAESEKMDIDDNKSSEQTNEEKKESIENNSTLNDINKSSTTNDQTNDSFSLSASNYQNRETSDGLTFISGPSTHSSELLMCIPKNLLTRKARFPTPPEPITNADEQMGKMVHPLLGTASVVESNMERENELRLIKGFKRIYHSFENDLPNIVKRRKLERSNKQLEMMNNSTKKDGNDEFDNPKTVNKKLKNLGGAANLSLKNLLGRIEDNRDKLNMTDVELKNLILDVRKNRSKWASYNKIGQEELYEACEKVVLELRGYTEHSTAFLNRVSKRDAPNYYQVIKKPMDLNTVLKKLKTFQYKNKKEFVDDVMLIWKNCLTYNSDPTHFLRVDALAMQKKTLQLIPLIPDITVRDRAEVEREAALLEAQQNEENNKTSKDGNAKDGVNNKPAGAQSTRGVGGSSISGKSRSKKGRGKGPDTKVKEELPDGVPIPSGENDNGDDVNSPIVIPTPASAALVANSGAGATPAGLEGTSTPGAMNDDDDHDDDELGDEEAHEDEGGRDEDDNGEEDVEIQTWRNLTSNTRYKLCVERSQLFKDGKLQPNVEAILRDESQMKSFNNYIGEKDNVTLHRNRKYYDETDDPYLIEYDVSGGVPALKNVGLTEEDFEKIDSTILEKYFQEGKTINDIPNSKLIIKNNGSDSVVHENIGLMQDIRKICNKISLIRQMQTQQYIHHTQMITPEIERLREIDVEPVERIEQSHEFFSNDICFASLRRSISKIIMANGFESTNPFCANILTQLAESYIGNLAKSMKLHKESSSINKLPIANKRPASLKDILLLSLLENGIEKPDVLYSYHREQLMKQNTKLKDLKFKMENFLKDLLRPGIQDITENNFGDDSDQFLNGDFSNEIGEDFFGFKELGLEREFGLLTATIPFHLLHSRLNNSYNFFDRNTKKAKYEDLDELNYPKLNKVSMKYQIGLLKPFYENLLHKSEIHILKQKKKNGEIEKLPERDEEIEFMENEDLPQKQRNNRPRVPPNGRISGIKRKLVATSFFLDKQDELMDKMAIEKEAEFKVYLTEMSKKMELKNEKKRKLKEERRKEKQQKQIHNLQRQRSQSIQSYSLDDIQQKISEDKINDEEDTEDLFNDEAGDNEEKTGKVNGDVDIEIKTKEEEKIEHADNADGDEDGDIVPTLTDKIVESRSTEDKDETNYDDEEDGDYDDGDVAMEL